jgi:general secretion pathway protein H
MIQRAQRGFTLLEMIIVLVIVGLVLAIVAARGPMHSSRLDVEVAGRDLAGALRLARSRAIAVNRPIAVAIAADRFQIDGMTPQGLPANVAVAGTSEIRFAPDGSSSGGSITLQAANRRITISVNWLTGQVRTAEMQ